MPQAETHQKKSTLGLAGNDVFVVLDDADLEKAVKIGVNAPQQRRQVCTAKSENALSLHERLRMPSTDKFTGAFKRR